MGALGTDAGEAGAEREDAGPVPTSFVALTQNTYWTPFASPGTVTGLCDPLVIESAWVEPRTKVVTSYEMTGAPPSNAGAVNDTRAEPENVIAETAVGASGTVAGITAFDAPLVVLPTPLTAVTVKV